MRKERKSIFESNSSSAHSVVITDRDEHIDPGQMNYSMSHNENFESVYIDPNGTWRIYDIQYGYGRSPFTILTTFKDKLMYAMCEFLGHLYPDDPEFEKWYNEFRDIAAENIPGFTDFRIDTKDLDIYLDENGNQIMRRNLEFDRWDGKNNRPVYTYRDENGNKKTAIFDEENYIEGPDIGMIDHQSAGLLKNFLKDKEIDLREFLTNKKYNVVIDGDEYNKFQELAEAGFFNNIISVYDTPGKDIEYTEWLKEQEKEKEDDTEN